MIAAFCLPVLFLSEHQRPQREVLFQRHCRWCDAADFSGVCVSVCVACVRVYTTHHFLICCEILTSELEIECMEYLLKDLEEMLRQGEDHDKELNNTKL